MGNGFKEKSIHNVNKKNYDEGYARIFGKKKREHDFMGGACCVHCGYDGNTKDIWGCEEIERQKREDK